MIMLRLLQSARLLIGFLPFAFLNVTADIPLRLQYPAKEETVVLTGVSDGEVEFRPVGRDSGGRAYLKIETLMEQGVILNFLFSETFYEAVEAAERGNFRQARPPVQGAAEPLLDFMELGAVPGNHLPAVMSYLEILEALEDWDTVVDVVRSIPPAEAPLGVLRRLGDLVQAAERAGAKTALVATLHNHLLRPRNYSGEQLEVLMGVAHDWRKKEDFLKAFELYRKVQLREGPLRTQARLWVAYCSFYLGHDLIPEVFLDVLPEMGRQTPGFPLRELIRARLALREDDQRAAMRFAAQGKTYANATDPWYPELLYLTATLYSALEMEEAAITAFNELAILFPDSPWVSSIPESIDLIPDIN